MCVIVKTKCFFSVLPITHNQSKTKTIPYIIFETFIHKISRCRSVFWVVEVRNIHNSFFVKNHCCNFKLSLIAFSSVIKGSPWKWNKKKKDNQKGEKIYIYIKQVKQQQTFSLLLFVYEELYSLFKNIVLEKVVYTMTFAVEFLLLQVI